MRRRLSRLLMEAAEVRREACHTSRSLRSMCCAVVARLEECAERRVAGQVLLPCPSLAVGQIGLARNEIPPPYGE